MNEEKILEALESENPFFAGMDLWSTSNQARAEFKKIAEQTKRKSCQTGLKLFDAYEVFYHGEIILAKEKAWQIFQEMKDIHDDETAYMQRLGAAYLLQLMVRHNMDQSSWEEATTYIAGLAENQMVSSRCREAAQIYRAMSCMALAMMAEVPMWIRNREFGVCSIGQQPYYGEESIDSYNLPNAMLANAQYLTYIGKPMQALNSIAEAQMLYRADRNRMTRIYMEILKACNYGVLHLMEEMEESLLLAAELIAEEGFWLILAEFTEDFGRDYIDSIVARYSQEGVKEVNRIADGFRERVETLHKILKMQSKPLTKQERKILYMIADGMSDKEIAEEVHIARGTVKYHTRRAYAKLEIDKNVKIKDVLAVRDVQAIWMK